MTRISDKEHIHHTKYIFKRNNHFILLYSLKHKNKTTDHLHRGTVLLQPKGVPPVQVVGHHLHRGRATLLRLTAGRLEEATAVVVGLGGLLTMLGIHGFIMSKYLLVRFTYGMDGLLGVAGMIITIGMKWIIPENSLLSTSKNIWTWHLYVIYHQAIMTYWGLSYNLIPPEAEMLAFPIRY